MSSKCGRGKSNFSYPENPGDVENLPDSEYTYLKRGTIEYLIFLEILPGIAGVAVFLFFLISSSFIVYGIIRHIYADHMLPYKKKTLRKLGKYPTDKRRKRFQVAKQSKSQTLSGKALSHQSIGSGSGKSSPTNKSSKPYYLDSLSSSTSDSEQLLRSNIPSSVHKIISFTSPPMRQDTQQSNVPKNIELPWEEEFPILPDVPKKRVEPFSKPEKTTTTNKKEGYDSPKPYFVTMSPKTPTVPKKEVKRESHVTWEGDRQTMHQEQPKPPKPNVISDGYQYQGSAQPQEVPKPEPIVEWKWNSNYKSDDEELHASARNLELLIQRRQQLREQRARKMIPYSGYQNGKPNTSEPPHVRRNSMRKSNEDEEAKKTKKGRNSETQ